MLWTTVGGIGATRWIQNTQNTKNIQEIHNFFEADPGSVCHPLHTWPLPDRPFGSSSAEALENQATLPTVSHQTSPKSIPCGGWLTCHVLRKIQFTMAQALEVFQVGYIFSFIFKPNNVLSVVRVATCYDFGFWEMVYCLGGVKRHNTDPENQMVILLGLSAEKEPWDCDSFPPSGEATITVVLFQRNLGCKCCFGQNVYSM